MAFQLYSLGETGVANLAEQFARVQGDSDFVIAANEVAGSSLVYFADLLYSAVYHSHQSIGKI